MLGSPPPPYQISFRGVMDLRMLLYMAAKGLVTRLQIMSTALRTLHSAHCVQLCCIKLPASNVGSAAIATHSHHTVCTVQYTVHMYILYLPLILCSRFTVSLRRSFLRPLRFKSSCQIRPSSRAQISCNVMSSLLSILVLYFLFFFCIYPT